MNQPFSLTAAICIASLSSPAVASEITVNVTGLAKKGGEIGCGLHSAASDFPSGDQAEKTVWVKPSGNQALCRFSNVAPGTYAVAVIHDLNGNRTADTNAIGLPTEGWGVSQNVRPALRAPRFKEAAFKLGSAPVEIGVQIK
jgi:uncharacterized protein (DUF2141 family)